MREIRLHRPRDPWVFVSAAGSLGIIALGAAYVPVGARPPWIR